MPTAISGRCSGSADQVYASDLAGRFLLETTADELSDEADEYFALDSSSDDDATENEEDILVDEHSDDATL